MRSLKLLNTGKDLNSLTIVDELIMGLEYNYVRSKFD